MERRLSDLVNLRGIWRTGIYKPALLVGILGWIAGCTFVGSLAAKYFNSSTTIDKIIVAILTFGFIELIHFMVDKWAIARINEKIESDLKLAIKIGKKYPQCRALCKELNPMLTDEMMWKYRSKKKSR